MIPIKNTKKVIEEIKKSKTKLIYVAGASASGKSYFAKKLAEWLKKGKKKVLAISSDDYYTNETNLQFMLYGTFDHPSLIEYDLLQKNIDEYFKTKKTKLPKYSFQERRRISYEEIKGNYDYIIVEWLYTISQLNNKNNPFKIFVHSPTEELIFRRIIRDQSRVKESLDAIVAMIGKVFPMRKLYGDPQTQEANITIDNDYKIMSKEGKEYQFKQIKQIPKNIWKLEKKEYIKDFMYNDENDKNGIIYVSEVYKEKKWLLNHIIITKSKLNDFKDNNYSRIVVKLYRPGSLTMLHTMLQTAWLKLIGQNEKIEETYIKNNKKTKIKRSRRKIYLVKNN